MSTRKIAIFVLTWGCVLALWGFPQSELHAALAPGDHTLTLEHQGRTRSCIAHVPPQARTGKALPVVLNFHGGGSHAAAQQNYTRLDLLADQEGFLAIYPNGAGLLKNRGLTWNAGNCCGYAQTHDIDDVGFVNALLADLARRTPIDRTRVYATGLSNGAMMVYRLAVEAADQIAAIAPVAGAMMVKAFTPSRPVPVLHIHSVDDPRAPYAGGPGQHQIEHASVEQTLQRWITFNGCAATPEVGKTIHWRKEAQHAEHTATQYTYGACREGAEVVLWKLTGAGHVWPGGIQDPFERALGSSTEVINANTEMWRFFSRFAVKNP